MFLSPCRLVIGVTQATNYRDTLHSVSDIRVKLCNIMRKQRQLPHRAGANTPVNA